MAETVYFANLKNPSGSIRHTGDELTGDEDLGQGDDEIVICDLRMVPQNVRALFFLATVCQHGQSRRLGQRLSGHGHHGLISLHLKARGCPPHSGGEAQRLRPLREAVAFQAEAARVDDFAAFDHSGLRRRSLVRRRQVGADARRRLVCARLSGSLHLPPHSNMYRPHA